MRPLRALVVFLLGCSGLRANLITNGSFEDGWGEWNRWGFRDLFAEYYIGSITAWTVASGSVDYVGPYWQAAHGNRSIDLNGTYWRGTLTQQISTTPGADYLVTFALAGNPDVQPRETCVHVWVDDPLISYADFCFTVNGQTRSNMGWVYRTWTFTASSTSTTLGFTSLDSYNDSEWGYAFGPVLDDISVELVVPEPSTVVLLGFGLLSLRLLSRAHGYRDASHP